MQTDTKSLFPAECLTRECPTCEGAGGDYVTPTGHANDPDGYETVCRDCAGTGALPTDHCPECGCFVTNSGDCLACDMLGLLPADLDRADPRYTALREAIATALNDATLAGQGSVAA